MQYAERIMSAPVGLGVRIDGEWLKTEGSYNETYTFGQGIADAYILQLERKRELGLERRENQWYLWTSRFSGVYPIETLETVVQMLRDIERGTIIRKCPEELLEYISGKDPEGEGVFIILGENNYEMWHPRNIDINDALISLGDASRLGWL